MSIDNDDDLFDMGGSSKSLDFFDSVDKKSNDSVEASTVDASESDNSFDIKKSDELSDETSDGSLPLLRGTSVPQDFSDLVKDILYQYEQLPKIDCNAIYKELSELTIRSCPTPTLQVINQELQRVQASKERLSDIMVNILQSYNLKKRMIDVLSDSCGYFSSEKSADKRKGEAVYRLSNFDIDFGKIDALLKSASHVARNLDAFQDNLSRRITIFQLQLKLHDIGRGAMPDFEFKDDIDDSFGLGGQKRKSESTEAESTEAETHNF